MTPYYKQREEYIRSQKPSVHHGIKIDRTPSSFEGSIHDTCEEVEIDNSPNSYNYQKTGYAGHVLRGQVVRCGCCVNGIHISKIEKKVSTGVRGKKKNEDMDFWG